MQELTFGIRDILKGPRLAWSLRKMYVAGRGLFVSWAVYLVFTYAALLMTGMGRETGPVALFRHFEFFPCLIPAQPGIAALLLWAIGMAFAVFILLNAAVAVARIAFEDLRGNEVFQIHEALAFAGRQRKSLLFATLVPGVIGAVFIIVIIIAGAFGRIPVIGELLVALSFLPLFFWALLGVFILIVFFSGIALVPSICASTGEDGLECVLQLFSSIYSRLSRWILYEIAAKAVTAIAGILLLLLTVAALHGMNILLGFMMGYPYCEVMTIALYRLPVVMDIRAFISMLAGFGDLLWFPYIVDTFMATGIIKVSGWLAGISLLAILTWVASYIFAAFYSSQVILFLILRKQKNGEDLRVKAHLTDFNPEISDPDSN